MNWSSGLASGEFCEMHWPAVGSWRRLQRDPLAGVDFVRALAEADQDAQSGDRQALRARDTLLAQLGALAAHVSVRGVPSDVMDDVRQDFLLKVCRRPGRLIRFRGPRPLPAYLRRVFRNLCEDRCRRGRELGSACLDEVKCPRREPPLGVRHLVCEDLYARYFSRTGPGAPRGVAAAIEAGLLDGLSEYLRSAESFRGVRERWQVAVPACLASLVPPSAEPKVVRSMAVGILEALLDLIRSIDGSIAAGSATRVPSRRRSEVAELRDRIERALARDSVARN